MARLRPAYLMRHGPFVAHLVFANEKACYCCIAWVFPSFGSSAHLGLPLTWAFFPCASKRLADAPVETPTCGNSHREMHPPPFTWLTCRHVALKTQKEACLLVITPSTRRDSFQYGRSFGLWLFGLYGPLAS